MFTSSHGAPQGYNYPQPRSPGGIEGAPGDYDHNDQDYLDFSLNLIDSQPQQRFLTNPRSFSESSRSRQVSSVDGQVIHSGISRQPKSVDPDSASKVNNKKSNLPSRATL